MEGLIPVVYKSLKKKRIQRRYECLSSGAAQPYNYNVGDFDDHHHHGYLSSRTQELDEDGGVGGPRHRRCNSVQGDRFSSMDGAYNNYKPKQLVRFRSHRVLSCLSAS